MLPKVHEVVLDNGFRALLVERRNLPVVASVMYYHVGSRDERSGETGLSHFLEHMMFKGTETYAKGEIDLQTSKLGGSNNAFTTSDNTAYYFAMASDRWETALEIEASRMRGCLLDEAEFTAEKSVVLEELSMGEDDPSRMLWQAVEQLAFQVHPYHHPVIGWRQDVERVDAAGMRSYYERNYGPNRGFLVAVGDFDAKRTKKRITELFGDIPCAEPRAVVLDEVRQGGERRAVIRAPGGITRLAMACHTCRMGVPDDYVLDVVSHVLGGGKNSRLHKRLVLDEEIATYVGVSNETRLDTGLFWALAEIRPGASVEAAEAMIREEIARFMKDGATAEELKRARVQIRSSFLFEDETVLDTALKLGRYEAAAEGGYKLLGTVLPTYDAISRTNIKQVAQRYFEDGHWNVVWSLPEDEEPVPPGKKRRSKKAAKKKAAAKKPKKIGAKKKPAKRPVKKVAKKAPSKNVSKSAKKTVVKKVVRKKATGSKKKGTR